MNIDEAKAQLTDLKTACKRMLRDEDHAALDIALWLLDREPMVILLRAEIDAEFCHELRVLDKWEREHPRPGS